MEKILNFINNEFVAPDSGRYLDNFNPSRGEVYSQIPESNAIDAAKAIDAAERAFPSWSQTPVQERSRLLARLADLIYENRRELAEAESRDNGKPLKLSRDIDIPRSESNFRFFSSAITQFHGESFLSDDVALNYTEASPLGVVVCISPWNLPLYLLTWKLAPALAAGNTVVAKPSEITPMTAFLLCHLVQKSGLPPGVLNVIHGTGPQVGEPLILDPRVKAVSFTGSTVTGRRIAESTAGQFKKLSLEMGGKNANIIFADCDLETALETSLRSSFANQGQICLCGSRILVEKSIYSPFRDELASRVRKLKIGDPLSEDTDQGALVSKAHWQKVVSAIQKARDQGGRLLCGGKVPSLNENLKKGYFLEPTLIEGLGPQSAANQEEIFGPVATLIPFENEKEAIEIANSTRYGLSASIWTRDVTRAHRVARELHSGLVWINTWMFRDLRTPFGGVKESGVGREGGIEALRFFTEVKNICVALK